MLNYLSIELKEFFVKLSVYIFFKIHEAYFSQGRFGPFENMWFNRNCIVRVCLLLCIRALMRK